MRKGTKYTALALLVAPALLAGCTRKDDAAQFEVRALPVQGPALDRKPMDVPANASPVAPVDGSHLWVTFREVRLHFGEPAKTDETPQEKAAPETESPPGGAKTMPPAEPGKAMPTEKNPADRGKTILPEKYPAEPGKTMPVERNPADPGKTVYPPEKVASSEEGGWLTVFRGEERLDLLDPAATDKLLGELKLPAGGKVSEVRLILAGDPVLESPSGEKETLQCAACATTGIKAVVRDSPIVQAGKRIRVTIEMDGKHSLYRTPGKEGVTMLAPVIRAKVMLVG